MSGMAASLGSLVSGLILVISGTFLGTWSFLVIAVASAVILKLVLRLDSNYFAALAATYPLSELVAAQTAFIAKNHSGNIVVQP